MVSGDCVSGTDFLMHKRANSRLKQPGNGAVLFGALQEACGDKMQREYAIRQIAKRAGYRLAKKGDESYRLVNARFNVVVYQLDGVPLEKVAAFLEQPTSQANSPNGHHR